MKAATRGFLVEWSHPTGKVSIELKESKQLLVEEADHLS